MNEKNRQRGMSFFSVLLVLTVVGIFVLVGLKVFPIYMESFKIDAAMESVIKDLDVSKQGKREIGMALARRLDIDDVKSVGEWNLKDTVKIEKKKDKISITVKYRHEVPLFGNLNVVGDFEKYVETK